MTRRETEMRLAIARVRRLNRDNPAGFRALARILRIMEIERKRREAEAVG